MGCVSLNGMKDVILPENLSDISDQEKAVELKLEQQIKELQDALQDLEEDTGDDPSQRKMSTNGVNFVESFRGQHGLQGGLPQLSKHHPLNQITSLKEYREATSLARAEKQSNYQKRAGIHSISNGNNGISQEIEPSLPVELYAPLKFHPKGSGLIVFIYLSIIASIWVLMGNSCGCTIILGSIFMIALPILMLLAMKVYDKNEESHNKVQKIKWDVVSCKEQFQNGLVTSPPFKTVTGYCSNSYCRAVVEWKLIIQREQSQHGQNKHVLGLLAVNIPPEVECISVKFSFSVVDQNAEEMKRDFTRTGDCAYSNPIKCLSDFNREDRLLIQCKLSCEQYRTTQSWILQSIGETLHRRLLHSKNAVKAGDLCAEHGIIIPAILELEQVGCSMDSPVNEFLRRCETQTFIWRLSGFSKLLSQTSFDGSKQFALYSPRLYVVSHGICSIWSLKLFEFQGVFRLHAKLRGLPSGTNRLQMHYVFQVQDSFGDFIIPGECGKCIQCGDYMKLWDCSRHLLYSRQTLLERFIQDDGSMCIRISLNLDPLETDLSPDFAEWVLYQ